MATQVETPQSEDLKKIGDLIKDIKIAMLTTTEKDGTLRSHPMATQQVEFDGDLWFFTQASSEKVHEVDSDQHVNVSFANADHNRYLSVSGKASLSRDRAKIEELWSPLYKAWFPEGLEDPNIALLKVSVEQAEYWDSPSSKVVQLFGLIKAAVTGKPYAGGEHEKVEISA